MANNIIDTSDQKSKEGDAKTQFDVICNDLDLNESIKTKAWDEFEQINRNVTLEVLISFSLFEAIFLTKLPTFVQGWL